MSRGRWILGGVALLVAAIVAVVLWPAQDPLAEAERVALLIGDSPPLPGFVDFESELRVVLSDRDIRIVSEEAGADIVLVLTELTVDGENLELSLTEGALTGRASAECILTEVETGRVHRMDFHLEIADGTVRARLVPRRFWQVWK